MHPDLAAFISAAVYDGRLMSAPETERQRVLADPMLDAEAVAPAGLRFVPVESLACTQRSQPEADRLQQRSEEHTSELQSLMRSSYAVFCLQKTKHDGQLTTQQNELDT